MLDYHKSWYSLSVLLELLVCVNNSWWLCVLFYLVMQLTTMSLDKETCTCLSFYLFCDAPNDE